MATFARTTSAKHGSLRAAKCVARRRSRVVALPDRPPIAAALDCWPGATLWFSSATRQDMPCRVLPEFMAFFLAREEGWTAVVARRYRHLDAQGPADLPQSSARSQSSSVSSSGNAQGSVSRLHELEVVAQDGSRRSARRRSNWCGNARCRTAFDVGDRHLGRVQSCHRVPRVGGCCRL